MDYEQLDRLREEKYLREEEQALAKENEGGQISTLSILNSLIGPQPQQPLRVLPTPYSEDYLGDIQGLEGLLNYTHKGHLSSGQLQNVLQGNLEAYEGESEDLLRGWSEDISDIISYPETVVAHNPLIRGGGEVAAYNQFQQELQNTEEGQRYSHLETKFANNDSFLDIMDAMEKHGTTGDPTIDEEYNEYASLKDSLKMKLNDYAMSGFPQEDVMYSDIGVDKISKAKQRQFTTDAVNKLYELISGAGLDPNTYEMSGSGMTIDNLIGSLYSTDVFGKDFTGGGGGGARVLDKLSRFGDIYQTSLMRNLK